jgi:hypothetical protein
MHTRFQPLKSFTAGAIEKGRTVTTMRFVAPPDQDVWLYRLVVALLGAVALASIVGAIMLSFADRNVPDFVVALASAAVGGLAGLLAPSPKRKK